MESIDFNFNEGVGRVIEYLTNFVEIEKTLLLEGIRQFDDIDDLKRAIEGCDDNESIINQAIEKLQMALDIEEVFDAVEDTTLGYEFTFIISLLLGIEINEI